MVRVYRFAAVRPEPGAAHAIASVPYDVVTSDEARAIITKNPKSFLRISRSDVELDHLPPTDDAVYARARENFLGLIKDGALRKDTVPAMYLYRVIQDHQVYLGLCCCVDVDDYRKNHIRRHEQTRYDKEKDRTGHIRITRIHSGPVVLLYKDSVGIFPFIQSLIPPGSIPETEVRTDNGIIHQIFRIADSNALEWLEKRFAHVPCLYIADGHHRAKSAVNVADMDLGIPGNDEINHFMGVLFVHDHVRIHGYSRLLTDIGAYTRKKFIRQLKRSFDVVPYGHVDGHRFTISPQISDPVHNHVIHMYIGGQWYECSRPVDNHASVIDTLDVTVLQRCVLDGMLGITDPRSDSRLQYLGGARPIADLEHLVDNGHYALAFAMQPVGIDTVLTISDTNGVMPPKSTWFEPKLLSGLVIHTFD